MLAERSARRLLSRMHTDVFGLRSMTESTLISANALRLAVGPVALSLAEVEAMQVHQMEDGKLNDTALFDAQTEMVTLLEAILKKAEDAEFVLAGQIAKIRAFVTQAQRMGVKELADSNDEAPEPGVEYVNVDFIAEQLNTSRRNVMFLVANDKFPPRDAIEEEGNTAHLWRKDNALAAIEIARGGMRKRGSSAFI